MEKPPARTAPQSADSDAFETRAFIAAKHRDRCWVVDLPEDADVVVGSAEAAQVRADGAGLAAKHAVLRWNGSVLTLTGFDGDAAAYLNGKRLQGVTEVEPGDEIAAGALQLVVGLAVPPKVVGRRALTHHEFRERLWEEMARATRSGRPTSLVMVQARAGEGGKVATVALHSFRAGDVIGTYAHDELEFLLPDTAGETARTVVERILEQSGALGSIAGLAVAPDDGDNPERLLRAARLALGKARRNGRTVESAPAKPPSDALPEVHDPTTRALVTRLTELAASDAPVLLTGEFSSGKGVFARLVHDGGPRAAAPFVTIHCTLLATDPSERTAWSTARGGTLFLDEVGDLPPDEQRELLLLLKQKDPSVRVVSSTYRALAGLVERGAFERELYERLAGEVVEIPPLRSRPEDIMPMAVRFAEEFGAPTPVRMSAGAVARMRSYPWPGNVLELRNSMERAVRLANGGEILAEHLPSETLAAPSGEGRLREHVDAVERDAIVKALADANHNQTHAAKRLGISRRALIYKMEKYGLKPPPGARR